MEFLSRTRLAWRALSSSLKQGEYSSLGDAVRHLRTRAGLTQEKLAHRSDVHPTWVSHIERGRVNVTHQTVVSIAAGIGIRYSQVVSLAETYEEIAETQDD
jgi:transcriptional regulator with XRE-family HTH domain